MVDKQGKFFLLEDLDPDFVRTHVDTKHYAEYAGRYVKNAYDDKLTDADYAARYASDLYRLKRKSLSHIRQALRLRGIDSGIIEQVLEPYEEEDEREQILRVIEKKYRARLEEDWEKNRPKVTAALMRLGFSYGDIRQALEEYGEDEDDGF